MRYLEFANAQDTLALWKMISDNTWAAVAQQAEAEKRAKVERAAARKSASKRGSGTSTTKPAPPKRLPPPLQHVSAPVAKDSIPLTSAGNKDSQRNQQMTVKTDTAMPAANAVQPTAAVSSITNSVPDNSLNKIPLFQNAIQHK